MLQCVSEVLLFPKPPFSPMIFVESLIGVGELVSRGYVILGGASQRAGGRAPAFRIAYCQTWTQVGHL